MEMSSNNHGEDTLESPLSRSMFKQGGLGNRTKIIMMIIGGSIVVLCIIVGFGIVFSLDHDTIGTCLLS